MFDTVVGGAGDVASARGAIATLAPAASEREAVDRLAALEELKAGVAAAQVRETIAFDRLRRDAEEARGVPAARRGAGVGAEVALARGLSPYRGAKALSLAKTLWADMPQTLAALSAGSISEDKAAVVVKETAWLSSSDRSRVDELIAERLADLGIKALGALVRGHSQRLDQAGAVAHLERCEAERSVSVRPAPGGMAYLTALLPMARAVAAYATVHRDAATSIGTNQDGPVRSHGQMMADLLVERLTGKSAAEGTPVELHLVMSDTAVMGASATPAVIPGYGPIPAQAGRDLIANTEAAVFLRRLYTSPGSGQLVAMDSRRRTFTGLLRRMIVLRDGYCRTPWCDAPIKHIDHARPHRDGGQTGWDNASGLCERCNYTKENVAWEHAADPSQLAVTTPTGHTYTAATTALTSADRPMPLAEQARKRLRDRRLLRQSHHHTNPDAPSAICIDINYINHPIYPTSDPDDDPDD